MPSAALSSLYNGDKATSRSRNITYHNLHNSDLKKLTSLLRDYPSNPQEIAPYFQALKPAIHDLPHHLRSTSFHLSKPEGKNGVVKPGKLCSGHAGLNNPVIHSIWSGLSFELNGGIGHFLYPIIMKAGLPTQMEVKLRQLEPVLEMWEADFDITVHTPEGRESLRALKHVDGVVVSKWRKQENQCPACIMSRLGADKEVLFALLAGMIGRFPARNIGKKDDIRSKRIRWVRYWLKKFEGGEELIDEAWETGEELRRVRAAWKEHVKGQSGKDFYGRRKDGRGSVDEQSQYSINVGLGVNVSDIFSPDPQTARYGDGNCQPDDNVTASRVDMDLSDLFTLDHNLGVLSQGHAKSNSNLSVCSRSSIAEPSPELPTEVRFGNSYDRGQAQQYAPSSPSLHSQHATVDNSSSRSSWKDTSSSIYSFDTTASEEIAHNHRTHGSLVPAPLRTSSNTFAESVDSIMQKPDRHEQVHRAESRLNFSGFLNLPTTNRRSVYAGVGGKGRYDLSPPASPVVLEIENRGDAGKRRTGATHWSELY